ncbi:putative cysteine protease [Cafeteria roenbergensis virus]|uniref:Putative cysteine protease n=1 Tax=Cafeteria roenbergensis virus (strain BV-PW1) TaxID=693272 RepID=E3T4V4_CROVB|nr:putative cysteine protease [Cafeteria roenbergensis virus BV-PW1]ADO67217.1 putative cysteine protease [Cafeteria roenbergensis virus BV-PW1]
MIYDTRCAPTKVYKDGSCFDYKSLVKIAQAYNKKFTHNINITSDKKELVKQLEDKLSHECDEQTCWLKQSFTREILDDNIKNTFRPVGPTQKNGWLSTINIDQVMEQYQYKYPAFLYLGTVPSDFEELPILGFNSIDFDKLLKKGKYKLGMVINLDEHNQSGSHWVALFINLKNNQVYFFDSFAKKPIKKIKNFINKIIKYLYKKEFGNEIPIKYLEKALQKYDKFTPTVQEALDKIDFKINKIQHQRDNSECGVYSINFILRLLQGDTFEEITNNPVNDKEMEECRKVYFVNY